MHFISAKKASSPATWNREQFPPFSSLSQSWTGLSVESLERRGGMEYLTLNRYTSPSTLLNYKLLHLCVSRLVLHPSPHPPQRSPRHHTCSPLDHFPNPRLGTRAATASQRKPLRISVCLRSPEIKSTLVFVLCAELYKRTTITRKKFALKFHDLLIFNSSFINCINYF